MSFDEIQEDSMQFLGSQGVQALFLGIVGAVTFRFSMFAVVRSPFLWAADLSKSTVGARQEPKSIQIASKIMRNR